MTKRGSAPLTLPWPASATGSVPSGHNIRTCGAAFVAQLYGAVGIVSDGMAAAALVGVKKGGSSRDG
jgi:hypothetical protein